MANAREKGDILHCCRDLEAPLTGKRFTAAIVMKECQRLDDAA